MARPSKYFASPYCCNESHVAMFCSDYSYNPFDKFIAADVSCHGNGTLPIHVCSFISLSFGLIWNITQSGVIIVFISAQRAGCNFSTLQSLPRLREPAAAEAIAVPAWAKAGRASTTSGFPFPVSIFLLVAISTSPGSALHAEHSFLHGNKSPCRAVRFWHGEIQKRPFYSVTQVKCHFGVTPIK